MSTKLCLFGVDPSTSDTDLLAACAKVFEERPPTRGFVGIQSAEKRKALKWFYLIVDDRWTWVFEEVAANLSRTFGDLTALLYMDNVGDFKFARYVGVGPEDDTVTPTLGLNSKGLYLEVYAGVLRGEHPELALTPAQVGDLQQKNEEELTDAERLLMNDFRNAVRLGLEECHPDDELAALGMGYENDVICLVKNRELIEPCKVARISLRGGLGNLPHYADLFTLARHGEYEPESPGTHAAYQSFHAAHAASDYEQVIAFGWRLIDLNASIYHSIASSWANAFAKTGDFAMALKLTDRYLPRTLSEASVDNIGLDLYNRACYLTQLGRLDEALEALTRAVELDPTHGVDARDDSDFATLKADERFVKLVAGATDAGQ